MNKEVVEANIVKKFFFWKGWHFRKYRWDLQIRFELRKAKHLIEGDKDGN